jgi:hypothetical protein
VLFRYAFSSESSCPLTFGSSAIDSRTFLAMISTARNSGAYGTMDAAAVASTRYAWEGSVQALTVERRSRQMEWILIYLSRCNVARKSTATPIHKQDEMKVYVHYLRLRERPGATCLVPPALYVFQLLYYKLSLDVSLHKSVQHSWHLSI